MPKRYKMQVWDLMQHSFKEYNDHMMHCRIDFGGHLDIDILRISVRQTFDIIPLLKSVFVTNKLRGYWQELDEKDIDMQKVVTLQETDSIDNLPEKFLVNVVDEYREPQIKMRIFRTPDKDSLAIIFNHMVCDGYGFKQYLKLLSGIYSKLLKNRDYICDSVVNPNRSFDAFYRSFPLMERFQLLFTRSAHGKAAEEGTGFPYDTNANSAILPAIIKSKLSAKDFAAIKNYSKANHYTLNDIIIAAYIRNMSSLIGKCEIPIDCIIDLRRYLKDSDAIGYTNFVSKIICDIGENIGEDMPSTIEKVHSAMESAKSDYPGVDGLMLLGLGYTFLWYSLAKKTIRKKFHNPLVAISNIGIIDEKYLEFGDLVTQDIYMTGSIKHNPYIQLALTTFKNEITFSIALYGNEADYSNAATLLCNVKQELTSIIDKGAK